MTSDTAAGEQQGSGARKSEGVQVYRWEISSRFLGRVLKLRRNRSLEHSGHPLPIPWIFGAVAFSAEIYHEDC